MKLEKLCLVALSLVLSVNACASVDEQFVEAIKNTPSPIPSPSDGTPEDTSEDGETTPETPIVLQFSSSGNPTIDNWRKDFARRSIAEGYAPDIVRTVLSDLSPSKYYFDPSTRLSKSLSAVENQAEFSKSVWQYVGSALKSSRIEKGQAKHRDLDAVFAQLKNDYGVSSSALLGIWGMETDYGGFLGNENAANILANMAAEGRRRRLGEAELHAIMDLIATGKYAKDELKSSYAGAVGHTQFMPSSVVRFAQDYEGDGRIDLWTNPKDALASAANYLKENKYVSNTPWGIEVILPQGFDYRLADGRKKTLADWKANGVLAVRPIDGVSVQADLWAPTGIYGPKFLLFPNFYAFKAYNNSDSYALGVGLLGDRASGKAGLSQAWPDNLDHLSKADIREIQTILTRLGHRPKGIDGLFGRNTANAIRRYQLRENLVADGYPTKALLQRLRDE